MGRGKKKRQFKQDVSKRGGTGVKPRENARELPEKARAAQTSRPAAPPREDSTADIPWTAERPQPVRRAFGIFKVGRIDFIGKRKWFLLISATLILVSILSLAVRGLNWGIDFTGGNDYVFSFGEAVAEADLRSAITDAGIAGEVVVRVDRAQADQAVVRTPYLDTAREQAMLDLLKARWPEFKVLAGDRVSPTITTKLLLFSLWATLLACVGILVYVAVRFEYRFAAAGVMALVHDALITAGVFSLFQLDVNAPFVAAILTVIGFSINDTVVVFDRVRDNLKRRGKEGLEALANRSINETFVRSVNTNVTAFLAVAAVYFFGGPTTKDLALALMIGILVGSYSTICVATPVWLWWRKRDEERRAAETARGLAPKSRPARG